MTLKERLSLIEYPNNRRDIEVKLTTKGELKKLFSKFNKVSIYTRSLNRESFLIGGNLVSNKMLNKLGEIVGWYNIVVARK